jgi:hypothetical protein
MIGINRIEIVEDTSSSLWQLRHGRRNQYRQRPGVAAHRGSQDADGNNGTPKIEYFASDRIGKGIGRAMPSTPTVLERRRERERQRRTGTFPCGNIDVNATVKFNAFSGKADYPITDHASVFGRVEFQRGSRKRQDRRDQRHGLEIFQRRHADPAAG